MIKPQFLRKKKKSQLTLQFSLIPTISLQKHVQELQLSSQCKKKKQIRTFSLLYDKKPSKILEGLKDEELATLGQIKTKIRGTIMTLKNI